MTKNENTLKRGIFTTESEGEHMARIEPAIAAAEAAAEKKADTKNAAEDRETSRLRTLCRHMISHRTESAGQAKNKNSEATWKRRTDGLLSVHFTDRSGSVWFSVDSLSDI